MSNHNESNNEIFNPRNFLRYEIKKFQDKRHGLIIAWILGLSYLLGFPIILEKIWPNKIEQPGYFSALVLYPTSLSILLIVNLEYLIIYKLGLPFFEKYKTSPDPWPWEVDKEKWNAQFKKTIPVLFINNFVINFTLLIPDLITNTTPYRYDINTIPSYFEIFYQLILCMFTRDFIFYCTHRILHTKYFYSKIHKIHHEYIETVCISATYSHFLEYIFANLLPSAIMPLILGKRMHLITYLIYICMVLHEIHEGHSGYTFPWSPHRILPFTFDAEFHIFHHWKYSGNYANYFSIWDRVFGTVNKSYIEYFKNKEKFIEKYKNENLNTVSTCNDKKIN